jgi:hypothetical protein
MLRSGSSASLCTPTTLFVTLSSLSTVTVYHPSLETVYIAGPCASEVYLGAPTTTLTSHSTPVTTSQPQVDTLYLTTPVRASIYPTENPATTKATKYVATITETSVLVITNVQLTPYQSGGHLTYSETAAPNGLLLFVVENGTTYWLNGKTPAPSKSYVIQTSVVTVEPIPEASPTSDDTSTIHLMHYSTLQITITERPSSLDTVSAASSHTPQSPNTTVSTTWSTGTTSGYAGSGSSFTGIGAGGWNTTSITSSGAHTGAIGSPTMLSLMSPLPSQPLSLASTFSLRFLTSLAAQSGFNAFSTSATIGSPSIPGGAHTLTVAPPYVNTTSLTLASLLTSSALGTVTSSSMSSFSTGSLFSKSLVNSFTIISSSFTTSVPPLTSTTTPSFTVSNQTSTPTSSTSSATPSNCGEYGDFTLTVSLPRAIGAMDANRCQFDDIPPLSVSTPNPDDVQPEPVFNPYHQFDFSDGFVVVPPPRVPYLPSSKPLFTEFIPNFNINGTNPMSGPNTREYGYSGDIGNGDHGLTGCFGFNLYGASLGCDSRGPPCEVSSDVLDCIMSFESVLQAVEYSLAHGTSNELLLKYKVSMLIRSHSSTLLVTATTEAPKTLLQSPPKSSPSQPAQLWPIVH